MAEVLIYKGDPAEYGGGVTFLKMLFNVLSEYGFNVEMVDDIDAMMLKPFDLIIYYGICRSKHELKMIMLLRAFKKPLLNVLGGSVLIRRPNRPLYLLNNILVMSKMVFKYKMRSKLYFAVPNTDDYELLSKLNIKPLYFPRGVDTKIFKPRHKEGERFTILCNACPASFVKGTDFLLKIILRIIYHLKETQVIILTGGIGFTHFRNILKVYERRFPNRVNVIDKWLTQTEIASILGRSHLLVFPSRFEGFGILVLEAQSCGVPVVAFDIPGAPRDVVLNDLTGKLIKPYDTNGLARQVMNYYKMYHEDPKYYSFIRFKCRERAMLFAHRRIGRLWVKQIQRLFHEAGL